MAAVTSTETFLESDMNQLAGLDRIYIEDLTLPCIIGIYPDERTNRQNVVINITLFADLSAACKSDRIEDTLDYKAIKQQVFELVQSSSFFLVEKLAESIATLCLLNQLVKAVRVRVDKPGALRYAKNVGIEILRRQYLS
jgi:FolB domain-containing protein